MMGDPRPPLILVAGCHRDKRLKISRILIEAGFRVIESDDAGSSLAEAATHEEMELIVSVDIPEVRGRALYNRFISPVNHEPLPVYYLSCGTAENSVSPNDDQADRFSPYAGDLVANIHALLRIHNAEEETRARLRDMIHLHEIGTRISETLDLDDTLRSVLSAIMEFQQATMGVLLLKDHEGHFLRPVISIGIREERINKVAPLPIGVAASGMAVANRRSVMIEDVQIDPRYSEYRAMAKRAGYRSIFSVPLLTRNGDALGALTTCWKHPHRPADWDMRLVELYARYAANAIENAQLYSRLQEEDRNKDEFLAMLAHELRNPLAPILNASQVMRLQAPNNDTLQWAIGMVERQTRHLTHLVDDLLDVSRITRGKIELHREMVTLRAILQNVIESSRPIIADREHRFDVRISDETIWLDADPTRLEQIFNNLLHNAAKYTPRGGQITLSAELEPPGLEFPRGAANVSVCDTGVGIAPEMLRRVFDVFSQAERTLDRAEGGLGLGLTLVRRLTEMHCGKVEAHSDGLGKGSQFIVRLPMVPLAPGTWDSRDHGGHQENRDSFLHAAHGQGHRVLVVDDQADTAQSLAELLEIWGHEVRIGYDGPSALLLNEEFNPEIVLLDIGLPLMNGYEVARRLRETAGRDLTLVAMTGYGQDEDRRRAMEAGFDLHMTKPVNLEVLRDLINSLSRI